MRIIHSIMRFLCCIETQTEDEESGGRSPLPVYPPNQDSSNTFFSAEGIFQKPDDLIQNPAPPLTIISNIYNNGGGGEEEEEEPALSINNSSPGISNYYSDDSPPYNNYPPEIDSDRGSCEAWWHYSNSDEDDDYTFPIDYLCDWAILFGEVSSANRLIKKIIRRAEEEEEEDTFAPVADCGQVCDDDVSSSQPDQIEDVVAIPSVGEGSVSASSSSVDKERCIKHYSSRHRILLVGEGDFSFSACLAVAFGCASNMIATSLNSEEFLKKNYPHAASNIEKLRSRGCEVIHGIDATKMAISELLGPHKFDRIIFNFPFVGFFKNKSRQEEIRLHTQLVTMFMKNAKEMVSENGEIHISHKTNGFHKDWDLESLASSHGLRLIDAVKFNHHEYPGYSSKYGFGGNKHFNCNPSRTYKFGLETNVRY